MENCQNGCPCKYFDCDSTLDQTDHVKGLESIGVLETTGTYCFEREEREN